MSAVDPDGEAIRPMVLLVEDDPTVADVVLRYLERDGFGAIWVADGAEGLARARSASPDLVLLDLMVPGMDGLEVCRHLRAELAVPIIMLTARGEEEDRLLGLELGADDYVTKPFSPREVVARVRAVLRRAAEPVRVGAPTVLRSGDLALDASARQAELRGEPLALTAREFDLLAHLMAHPGQAFRRDELLEAVWGWTYGDASTVTVHIRRLREKVEQDPSAPARIATVWGVGYRWDG